MTYIKSILLFLLFTLNLAANIATPFNKQAKTIGNSSFTVTDFNLQVGGFYQSKSIVPTQPCNAFTRLSAPAVKCYIGLYLCK